MAGRSSESGRHRVPLLPVAARSGPLTNTGVYAGAFVASVLRLDVSAFALTGASAG